MLTIGQLAEYAGTTVRTVRHYHAVGLLPEPERDGSGYRRYGAQALIELRRIRALADAGVPLGRIAALQGADEAERRAAVREIDAALRERIRGLQATRKQLRQVIDGRPELPPGVAELHARMREAGVSERTIECDEEGWILSAALYPDSYQTWLQTQLSMLENPEFLELTVLTDRCYDWPADDPRVEDLAQRQARFVLANAPLDDEGWDADRIAYELVTTYRQDESPGWRRLMERTAELIGRSQWAGAGEPGGARPGS